jgi:enterochelin esterase-like enzyme
MQRGQAGAANDWSMSGRRLGLLWSSLALVMVACGPGSSGPSRGTAGQGGGAGAAAGTSGAAAAPGGAGSGGAAGAAGTEGSAGTTGAAGTTGIAGAGGANAGAAGAAGAGAAAGGGGGGGGGTMSGAAGTPGLTDPGIDGDGDNTVAMGFKPDPANAATTAPQGRIFTFVMKSSESMIYPGRNGPYMRNVYVYVPMQYVAGTPAPFIVVQDGGWDVWFGTKAPHAASTGPNEPGTASLPHILDNYISMAKLPKLVALFVDNGGGDAEGSERGLEYDTVSGRFAEFIDQEVLPRVVTEAKTQLSLDLAFTKDPQGRATMGGSSGGAGSFSMVWFHPDLFARAITFSGTFVRQASPEDPMYPHGCWAYHDYDPYDMTAPNGVIVREPTTKPIRVWHEVGSNDLGAGSGPGSYRDFRLANQRMAASFKMKGYHYHFDLVMGAGHVDGNAIAATLPGALIWLWRGYPTN